MLDIEGNFRGKKILVTGGSGTVGSAIVRALLKYDPEVVRVLDNDETRIFMLEQEFRGDRRLRYLIGDVRDKNRLHSALRGVDIVFHAAALKHVASCEYNPFEAIKTNVVGLQNLIDVSIDEGVKNVVFTSSDKATNPNNVMGTTKLLGEKLITAANYYKGSHDVKFSSIRFGNVLGSSGSVVPLFKEQIRTGGHVTITDHDMTRFMMSESDAINLIFRAFSLMKGGEVFVLKMPVFRVTDLAGVIIESVAPKCGYEPCDIKVQHIGVKPGEKPYEELMTEEESKRALETEDMFIILPEINDFIQAGKYRFDGAKTAKVGMYTSRDMAALSKEDIRSFLANAKLL